MLIELTCQGKKLDVNTSCVMYMEDRANNVGTCLRLCDSSHLVVDETRKEIKKLVEPSISYPDMFNTMFNGART